MVVPGKKGATVLVCSGDLGAGKTAFVKGIATALGVKDTILSPTFVIQKIYKIPHTEKKKFGFSKLIHIDAYRLDFPHELLSIGWREILKDVENLIVVEWGEKFKNILPRNYQHIHFEFVDENTRTLTHKK